MIPLKSWAQVLDTGVSKLKEMQYYSQKDAYS